MLGAMPRAPIALSLLAVAFLVGCNTDPAVFVLPAVTSPKVTVLGGALGVEVSGSFDLDLHLSARASGSSTVGLGEFELVTNGDESPIVSPLPGLVSDQHFPVTVDQDSDVTAHFMFDSGKNPLDTNVKDQLCGAGSVVVKGVIEDSLKGSSTPVISDPVKPSGC